MLEEVKKRCYINSTLFNDEIKSLIKSCIQDLKDVDINTSTLSLNGEIDEIDDQLLNCVVIYVKAYRGNDREDTDKYLQMYESIKNKLSLQEYYKREDENE